MNPTPSKPFAPACERNREPILSVLRTHFAEARHALELGSGTGQHAVHFAAAMPWLEWQCSDQPEYLPGIRQWLDEAALPNTPPPIALAACNTPTPGLYPAVPASRGNAGRFDAAFSANTLHIMGWPEVEGFFAGLDPLLATDAVLVVYGPFNDNGAFSSPSNEAFDAWLKQRDGRSGIRDFEAVNRLAGAIGLDLLDDVAMPANNRCLVWRRRT